MNIFLHFSAVLRQLVTASTRKDCGVLASWAQSISNHLYWCAASSGGDGQLVWDKWCSIVNHTVNIHTGHGPSYPACTHEELVPRQWLEKGNFYAKSFTQNKDNFTSTFNLWSPTFTQYSHMGTCESHTGLGKCNNILQVIESQTWNMFSSSKN